MTHIIPKKSLNHADNSGESKMSPVDFLWWMETQISKVEKIHGDSLVVKVGK